MSLFDEFDVAPQGGDGGVEGQDDFQDDFADFTTSQGNAPSGFDLDASISDHGSQADSQLGGDSLTGSVDLTGSLTGSQDLMGSRTSVDSANVLSALPASSPGTPYLSHKDTELGQNFPEYLQWQEKHRQEIAAKEAEEKKKHDAILKTADEERKNLYEERRKRIESNKTKSRTEQNGGEAVEGGLWERAAKMVDFNTALGQKDVSRMKEVLIRLKH